MLDGTHSSDGVITKPSSNSVPQTIDGLRRLMADRGFTVFNVIDHSGVADELVCRCPTRNSSHVHYIRMPDFQSVRKRRGRYEHGEERGPRSWRLAGRIRPPRCHDSVTSDD
jgi:hypothetical protein